MSEKEEAGCSSETKSISDQKEDDQERHFQKDNNDSGNTSTENLQSISAQSESCSGTEAITEHNRRSRESSAESVSISSQRFGRRNHGTRRQYRRRSGESESSGEEQAPVST